jgi:phospho-N-acetylmuramoyl-pentapeptide-transferase
MSNLPISVLTLELAKIFGLSVVSFVLAMLLTPIYTFFAYKYKFWKKQRSTSTTGEKLEIFTKLHAKKFRHNIPTMAGMVFIIAILCVCSVILD